MEDSTEKTYGILAYLGILVIIPLIAGKSTFSRFHANYGLILAIVEVVFSVAMGILSFIPIINVIAWIACSLIDLACFVLAIMGIVSAANGEMNKLPVIGNIYIIK